MLPSTSQSAGPVVADAMGEAHPEVLAEASPVKAGRSDARIAACMGPTAHTAHPVNMALPSSVSSVSPAAFLPSVVTWWPMRVRAQRREGAREVVAVEGRPQRVVEQVARVRRQAAELLAPPTALNLLPWRRSAMVVLIVSMLMTSSFTSYEAAVSRRTYLIYLNESVLPLESKGRVRASPTPSCHHGTTTAHPPLAACALAGCSVALLWALLGDLLARDLTFRLCCDSLCSRHDVGGGAATSLSVRDAFRCKTLRKKRVAACCSAVGSLATVVWCSSPSWGSSCATFDLYSAELRYWFNRRSAGKQPPVTTTSKNACVALGYRHAL